MRPSQVDTSSGFEASRATTTAGGGGGSGLDGIFADLMAPNGGGGGGGGGGNGGVRAPAQTDLDNLLSGSKWGRSG
jgi:hypothetical protein